MYYNLNNLGSQNFEHLIQSLSKKILGEGVSIFGAGPDGQREATFEGHADYPSCSDCWNGYWVIQAKFKESNTKKADYPWLKECFEEEMKNFQLKKSENKKIPDNYLFFTNIVLSPVAEKGIKDKINGIVKKYTDLVPNIHILGADDICRFLDGHRDVATTYSSYILSGDILNLLYNHVEEIAKNRQNAFFRYLQQAFLDDYCSRMEQAGQVTEDKVSIDRVYIDLNFKYEDSEEQKKFIEHAVNVGNEIFRFSTINKKMQIKNNGSENMLVSNKYVLKGLAGQGKSTVCQFLAQIYRAFFLKNYYNSNNSKIDEFIENIETDDISIPTCFRVPIRIELRLFSSWMLNRQKEGKLCDLVTYISSIIGDKASDKFDNETLRLYFSKYSWVFFFDGLDEVPESSNRREIMSEIEHFIDIELQQADTDALFFATTRPEGYVGEFNKSNFTHIDLVPLDRPTCFSYLNKLLIAIEDDSTKRNNYLDILKQGWDNKQIAFMMQTPLQATIIAILVRAGGEPPRDKYSLFKEYFDIIIKREKQKGMGTILNTNQELIESVYYLLGYDLQKRSSSAEGSDALISLIQMKELISNKLKEDGIETTDINYYQLLDDAYSMIVNRINFATEIKEGYIGFSIRSMQEFLAAVYIEKTFDDIKLGKSLSDLAKSSYWRNTFIFLVECIAKEKSYFLDHIIDTTLSELNGTNLSFDELSKSECASIYYGSQVAFSLLANNIFKNKPKYENKLCKYITGFSNLQYIPDMIQVLSMSDNVKKELIKYLLNKDSYLSADFALASVLIQDEDSGHLLIDFSKKYARDITTQYFSVFNGNCHKSLYEAISIAINNEVLLQLNASQVINVITNVHNIESINAKKTLFMIVLKAMYSQRFGQESMEKLRDFFDCDLKPLYNIISYFEKGNDVTDYFKVKYYIPTIDAESLCDVIELLKLYSLEGLVLILNTIGSKDIEDYKAFCNNIEMHKHEIELLKEKFLINQNKLLRSLWETVLNSDCELGSLLSDNVANDLLAPKEIKDLYDLLEEYKKDFSPYVVFLSISFSAFIDLYKKMHDYYTEEQIRDNSQLCNIIIFAYTCVYKELYNNKFNLMFDFISDKEGQDENAYNLAELDKYFSHIFEYALVDNKYSIWKNYLWYIAFLKMDIKDLAVLTNKSFCASKNQDYARHPFSFKEEDKERILKKIVTLVGVTENTFILDLLYDFVLSEMDFSVISKTDWACVEQLKIDKLKCLSEISKAKTTNDVEKIIPFVINDEISEFVYNFIINTHLPEYFLPIYLYYLRIYREKNNLEEVQKIERIIKEYIMSRQIQI